jgi:aminoglycoside 3-N-acetyltransferase I
LGSATPPDGAGPRLAHRQHGLRAGRGGGLVVGHADIARHHIDGGAGPGAFLRVDLIGARPGGHQVQLHAGVARPQHLGHLAAGRHQLRPIARLLRVQRAVAVHHHRVPAAAGQHAQLVLEMEVEPAAAAGLERDVVVEPGLVGKRLEQRRHAANALVVEVRHRLGAVEAHGRSGAEGETVADEQEAGARLRVRGRQGERDEGEKRRSDSHGGSFWWPGGHRSGGFCHTLSMADIQTRRLTPAHRDLARTLFDLMNEVFEAEPGNLSDAYLDRLLARPDFWAFAAFVGDTLAGGLTAHTLQMTRAEQTEVFIYDLAVRPDLQRQGVGRALVTALCTAAAAEGVDSVFVPADNEDDHALAFYRSLAGDPAPVTIFTFAPGVTAARG